MLRPNRAVTVLRSPWKFSNSSEHHARFVAAAGLVEQPRETVIARSPSGFAPNSEAMVIARGEIREILRSLVEMYLLHQRDEARLFSQRIENAIHLEEA